MKIYVAGRTSSYKEVRKIQNDLVEAGHKITYDWTRAVSDEVWEQGSHEADLSPEFQRNQAERDVAGVENADILVFVAGNEMVGSYIEFGIAIEAGCSIIIVGEVERMSVFYFLPYVTFIREEDLLTHPSLKGK